MDRSKSVTRTSVGVGQDTWRNAWERGTRLFEDLRKRLLRRIGEHIGNHATPLDRLFLGAYRSLFQDSMALAPNLMSLPHASQALRIRGEHRVKSSQVCVRR